MCQILADNICFGTWAMYGQGLVLAYLPLSKIWSTDKSIVLELENSNCNSKSSRTRELELQHECGTVLVGTVDFKEWLHTLLKSFAEGLPPQFGKSCSRPATLCKALHLDNLSPTRSILLLGIALWYLVLLLALATFALWSRRGLMWSITGFIQGGFGLFAPTPGFLLGLRLFLAAALAFPFGRPLAFAFALPLATRAGFCPSSVSPPSAEACFSPNCIRRKTSGKNQMVLLGCIGYIVEDCKEPLQDLKKRPKISPGW